MAPGSLRNSTPSRPCLLSISKNSMILQVSPDRPDTQMADFFENFIDDSNDSILNVCIYLHDTL